MSFENKVVIVTGGGGGIGGATAKAFAKEGACVVIVDIDESNMKTVGDQLAEYKKKYLLIKANVSKDEDAKIVVKKTIEVFKKIDVLINNAGSIKLGNILNGKLVEAFDEMIKNNLRSVLLLTSIAAPYLIKSKGNVVNLSSIAAVKNSLAHDLMPYSISKIGIDHFTRGAALELGPLGVRVNAVRPGQVMTNILNMVDGAESLIANMSGTNVDKGKICKTEDIANLILFVASDKGKSITGSVYTCDNGVSLM